MLNLFGGQRMTKETGSLPSDLKRHRLIKVKANTNPNYGKSPSELSVAERIQNGVVFLDKPSGPSSHQVVSWVKEILHIDNAGHSGTLDPKVTGVLSVALGKATRGLQGLLQSGKEYVGIMKLHASVPKNKLTAVMHGFIGDIQQVPPVRSAVKRQRRTRRVYYLTILETNNRDVLFQVGCEAGTYIRTLCVDIGKKLGCGAHLAALRRTRVGSISEKDTVILQDVKDAYHYYSEESDSQLLDSVIHPMEKLLVDLPKIVVRDSAVDAICHGAELAVPGVVELDSTIKNGDVVAMLTLKGEGIAIGTATYSTEQIIEKDTGICVSPHRVLMNKNTYPSVWKKS